MEKITLTGGTLMGNHNKSNNNDSHNHSHAHHGHHQDPLATPQAAAAHNNHNANNNLQRVTLTPEQQIELSKLVLKPMSPHNPNNGNSCPHHHNHGHTHSHGHSHNHAPQPRVQHAQWKAAGGAGAGIQVPAAALSLMQPLSEILQGPPHDILEALSTLLRLGQYEKWAALAQALTEQETNGHCVYNNTNNTAASASAGNDSSLDHSSQHNTNNNSNNNKNVNQNTWWLWMDANGHTLLHWAAKRGDDKRFVAYFLEHAPAPVLQQLLHTTSHDKTAMTPLHWACTEPGAQSLGILSMIMTNTTVSIDWEVTDASGCTPLLIAAQYGQVEVCAYLLQKGRADLYAMDTSLDTALHWASYKGSLPVCGLLWWYHEQQQQQQRRHGGSHHSHNNNRHHKKHNYNQDLMAPDQFGQTPLHLAALRGHTSTVRWLLQRTAPTKRDQLDLLYHKDTNGRTPLDLAIHKHRPTVQAVLQNRQDQLASYSLRERSHWQLWQRHCLKSVQQMTSLHAWKLWMGLLDHADEMDEAPQFPYYYLWANGLFHILVWYPFLFLSLHNPAAGLLWDLPFWHLINMMNIVVAIVTLQKTTYTNPGNLVVDEEEAYKQLPKNHKKVVQYWRKLYETTLESYATTDDMQKAIQQQPLCHTCHIARPLRSKHCRVTRSCVLMFDHNCPFVGNTVGLYNYPYFYLFLTSLAFLHLGFLVNLTLFLYRSPKLPWGWMLLGIFHALHIVPTGGMWIYHTQLSVSNLTTNEHMNLSRYEYLNEKSTNSSTGQTTRRFHNPWFKSYFRNLLDRLSPTEEMYMIKNTTSNSSSNRSAEEQDDEEKQQRQGLLSHYHDSTV